MKKIIIILFTATTIISCSNKKDRLYERAFELCNFIPDHELVEESENYLTKDFYAVLDSMFNYIPDDETLAREWLYFFVTGNGGTIADYEVTDVNQIDDIHAVATIKVRQKWENGSFDETSDIENHKLYMEKIKGKWLMSDFDGHKQDCINYLENYRKEQLLFKTIANYLINDIAIHYLTGDVCIPTIMIVGTEEKSNDQIDVFGDFWVFWYNAKDDTLKTISGGNHSGRITISKNNRQLIVTDFEQTTDGAGNLESAKRIFGNHYEIFNNIHSNPDVREAARKMQILQYVKLNNLPFEYYQDYLLPAQSIK